ncbi:MAG: hypothetical protein AAB460_03335 [Patescibacteria group bacterium]
MLALFIGTLISVYGSADYVQSAPFCAVGSILMIVGSFRLMTRMVPMYILAWGGLTVSLLAWAGIL